MVDEKEAKKSEKEKVRINEKLKEIQKRRVIRKRMNR
jgi:hypothetical protein